MRTSRNKTDLTRAIWENEVSCEKSLKKVHYLHVRRDLERLSFSRKKEITCEGGEISENPMNIFVSFSHPWIAFWPTTRARYYLDG